MFAAAAGGETIVITDRGRPLAEIVPPQRDTSAGSKAAHCLRSSCCGMREGWAQTPATIRDGSPPRQADRRWRASPLSN